MCGGSYVYIYIYIFFLNICVCVGENNLLTKKCVKSYCFPPVLLLFLTYIIYIDILFNNN